MWRVSAALTIILHASEAGADAQLPLRRAPLLPAAAVADLLAALPQSPWWAGRCG